MILSSPQGIESPALNKLIRDELRDKIAIEAMVVFLKKYHPTNLREAVEDSYRVAEMMLKERKKYL